MVRTKNQSYEEPPSNKRKQFETSTSSIPQQTQMQHKPIDDTNKFFNKYDEARYYVSLKREVYTKRKVQLKEEEFNVI